jgi:hypothetical protein
VSLEDLAERVGEPKSTIHAYLTGKRLAPSQVLDRIVIALGTTAAEQREWAEAWYRVSADREAGHRAAATTGIRESVPRQLPGSAGQLTGRAVALDELDELLMHTEYGLLAAITGMAGVGKTALAVHWAQTRAERFPDGQLYLDLQGFDPDQPIQPGQALARFLRALGVAGPEIPREMAERAALYRSLLAGRRMLILLDNARDVEQLRSLLPGTSSCTVLVTSRDSLSGLIARHGAHRLELDVFEPAASIELLRALIGPRVEREPGPAARLGQLCGSLPLALRIVAERATEHPGWPLRALADELGSGSPLELLDAGEDPRTAIRPVLDWSYQRLTGPAAPAFRLIGLQPGPELTVAAVAALTGAGLAEAQRALVLLGRAHLIQQIEPGRYGMHPLLRAFARELCLATDAEADRSAALARLFEHQSWAEQSPVEQAVGQAVGQASVGQLSAGPSGSDRHLEAVPGTGLRRSGELTRLRRIGGLQPADVVRAEPRAVLGRAGRAEFDQPDDPGALAAPRFE